MRINYLQKKKKSSLKRKIFGGLFFCFLGISAYFFFFSPLLWTKEIEVKELKNISEAEIREIIQQKLEGKFWQIIPQKNIFLVPVDKIKAEILTRYPEIRSVTILKKIPYSLAVVIEERQSIGIWCQKTDDKIENCFYIDQEGIIFKEAPIMSGSLILNIYSSETANLRAQVASSEIIDFIIKIADQAPLKIIDFEIVSLEDLKVRTAAGWQIYFNPTYSVDSQFKALEMVLEKEIKENWLSLEYIDLRIEGRVYYK